MTYEIFTYWQTGLLETILNAAAAVTNSNGFAGLLRTLALAAVLAMAIVVLAGRGRMDEHWRWVVMVALFNGALLVPKATVQIVDRAGYATVRVVDNVPLGLAAPLSATSKIGDFLTTSFETVFSLPDDIRFSKSGMLFGGKIVRELLLNAQVMSASVQQDLQEFYRECVAPDLASGYIKPDELKSAVDAWGVLAGKLSPGLMVELKDVGVVSCDVAYTTLTSLLTQEQARIKAQVAAMLFPEAPSAVRVSLADSAISTVLQDYTGIAQDSTTALRHAMAVNWLIDSQWRMFQQIGDPGSAQVALAQAQSLRAMNQSYQVMAKVGEQIMPKLRNVIEAIQIGIAPLVLLLVVVLGHHGTAAFGTYLKSLLWVQLWPPLYAVVNYVSVFHEKAQFEALPSSAGGLPLELYQTLLGVVVDDAALAGMVAAVGVPTIAWALVSGAGLGMNAFSAALGTMRGADPSRYAGELAQGNLRAGQMNDQPNVVTGAGSVTTRLAHGGSLTQYADGSQNIDMSAVMPKLSAKIGVSQALEATHSRAAEESYSGAVGDAAQAGASVNAAMTKLAEAGRAHVKGAGLTHGTATADENSITRTATEGRQAVTDYAKANRLNDSQRAMVEAAAAVEVSTPKILKGILPTQLAASMGWKGVSASEAQQVVEHAQRLAEDKRFQRAVSDVTRLATTDDYKARDEHEQRALDSVRGDLSRTKQFSEQASARFEHAQTQREAAQEAKRNAASIDHDATGRYVSWMLNQYNPTTGQAFDAKAIADMERYSPEDAQRFKQQFVQQVVRGEVEQGMPKLAVDPRQLYAQGRDGMSPEAVERQGELWRQDALQQGQKLGVSPFSAPPAAPDIAPRQAEMRGEIDKTRAAVDAQGQPIREAAKDTEPHSQTLTKRAVGNAWDQRPSFMRSEKHDDAPAPAAAANPPAAAKAPARQSLAEGRSIPATFNSSMGWEGFRPGRNKASAPKADEAGGQHDAMPPPKT
jgi:conjugal transfer mating pair stabilization protein TraG